MVVGFLVRSGLVVGAFYYSKKAGVWGSPEDTEKLYSDIIEEIRPHAQRLEQQMPFKVPALPQTGEIRFLTKHYYNEGVKNSFHFIEMLPCYMGQMAKKAKTTFEEFSQSPKTNK